MLGLGLARAPSAGPARRQRRGSRPRPAAEDAAFPLEQELQAQRQALALLSDVISPPVSPSTLQAYDSGQAEALLRLLADTGTSESVSSFLVRGSSFQKSGASGGESTRTHQQLGGAKLERLEHERSLASLEVTLAHVEEGLSAKQRALLELRRSLGGLAELPDVGSLASLASLEARCESLTGELAATRAELLSATQLRVEAERVAAVAVAGEASLRSAMRASAEELELIRAALRESQESEEDLRSALRDAEAARLGTETSGRAEDSAAAALELAQLELAAARGDEELTSACLAAAELRVEAAEAALEAELKAMATLRLQLAATEDAQRSLEAQLADAASAARDEREAVDEAERLRAELTVARAEAEQFRIRLVSERGALAARDGALEAAAARFAAARLEHLRLLAEAEERLRELQAAAGAQEARCAALASSFEALQAQLTLREEEARESTARLVRAHDELRLLRQEGSLQAARDLAALRSALARIESDAATLAAMSVELAALRAVADGRASAEAERDEARRALTAALDSLAAARSQLSTAEMERGRIVDEAAFLGHGQQDSANVHQQALEKAYSSHEAASAAADALRQQLLAAEQTHADEMEDLRMRLTDANRRADAAEEARRVAAAEAQTQAERASAEVNALRARIETEPTVASLREQLDSGLKAAAEEERKHKLELDDASQRAQSASAEAALLRQQLAAAAAQTAELDDLRMRLADATRRADAERHSLRATSDEALAQAEKARSERELLRARLAAAEETAAAAQLEARTVTATMEMEARLASAAPAAAARAAEAELSIAQAEAAALRKRLDDVRQAAEAEAGSQRLALEAASQRAQSAVAEAGLLREQLSAAVERPGVARESAGEVDRLRGALAEASGRVAAEEAELQTALASARAHAESSAAEVEQLRALLGAAQHAAADAQRDAAAAAAAAVEAEAEVAAVAQRAAAELAAAQEAAQRSAQQVSALSAQLSASEAAAPVQAELEERAEEGRRWAAAMQSVARFSGGSGSTLVTFQVRCETPFGQCVRLSGNVAELGGWDISRSIVMAYRSDGVWTTSVRLQAGRVYEYKFLLCTAGGELRRWQPGADAVLTIFRDEETLLVNDAWSCDPTLSSVQAADGRVEGRQARLFQLLQAFRGLVDASLSAPAPPPSSKHL